MNEAEFLAIRKASTLERSKQNEAVIRSTKNLQTKDSPIKTNLIKIETEWIKDTLKSFQMSNTEKRNHKYFLKAVEPLYYWQPGRSRGQSLRKNRPKYERLPETWTFARNMNVCPKHEPPEIECNVYRDEGDQAADRLSTHLEKSHRETLSAF